jgi:hypothetical protein
MRTTTINTEVTLEVHDCPVCGVPFGLTAPFLRGRRQAGASFYCPNGHALSFDSENERLKRELERARESQLAAQRQAARLGTELAQADSENKRLRTEAGKAKRRAAAGCCPCCKRTISQMARHIRSKHPEFVDEARRQGLMP